MRMLEKKPDREKQKTEKEKIPWEERINIGLTTLKLPESVKNGQ